jgi:hypothetical protein
MPSQGKLTVRSDAFIPILGWGLTHMYRLSWSIAVLGSILLTPSSVQSQTRTASCEFDNADKSFSGPCLVTEVRSSSEPRYTIKVTIPSQEIEVKYLKHQGPYHRWTINGAAAAAYEIDRGNICGFTDDLSIRLCIKDGASSKPPQPAEASGSWAKPFYVGRWYSQSSRVCKGRTGETEGLLTYSERQFVGHENSCDILSVTPVANRLEMRLKCSSEGNIAHEREVIQLLRNGHLSRTVFDGARSYSFEHRRCPN